MKKRLQSHASITLHKLKNLPKELNSHLFKLEKNKPFNLPFNNLNALFSARFFRKGTHSSSSYLAISQYKQSGFTLIELMVVIAIIAILGAVAVPAYQRYIQKASMTDMLQTLTAYKTSVELCTLQHSLSDCNQGDYGIPMSTNTRYVSSVTVNQGVIELVGQQALQGLTLSLQPETNNQTGTLEWSKECMTNNQSLKEACEDVIAF